jgi:hypothetical protein
MNNSTGTMVDNNSMGIYRIAERLLASQEGLCLMG